MLFNCEYIDQFLVSHTLNERTQMASKLRFSRPHFFPMIVDVRIEDKKRHNMSLVRNKFLMPEEETYLFMRRKFQSQSPFQTCNAKTFLTGLKPGQAIHLYSINSETGENRMLFKPNCYSLSLLYEEHKSPDDFLYIIITTEDTFG